MDIEHKKLSKFRHQLIVNGQTIGWINKWFKTDWWNNSQTLFFAAKPIGLSEIKWDCPTYDNAVAYILGYHEDVIGEK